MPKWVKHEFYKKGGGYLGYCYAPNPEDAIKMVKKNLGHDVDDCIIVVENGDPNSEYVYGWEDPHFVTFNDVLRKWENEGTETPDRKRLLEMWKKRAEEWLKEEMERIYSQHFGRTGP